MSNKRKPEITTRRYLHDRPDGSGLTVNPDYGYITGIVSTFYGYVHVYAQFAKEGDPPNRSYCDFSIILDGWNYRRTIRRFHSRRRLVTLADRFAAEMDNGEFEESEE